MGICMSLHAASDDKIDEISKDADSLQQFVDGCADRTMVNFVKLIGGFQALADTAEKDPRFAALAKLAGSIPKVSREDDSPHVDLDKVWHGLHYFLTGSADGGEEPCCYLACKGRNIGLYNGVGVRAISSSQLTAFELALQPIDKDELLRRFDGAAMAEADVYLSTMWEQGDPAELDFAFEKFALLKEFLGAAKARHEGAIIWTS